jgi:tRNA threonylcarbamoyladenosine biosynthesis protein TsaB
VKLLAIDTSAAACSAALLRDGQITQRVEEAPRRHGELILSMMDGLLRDADLSPAELDALAFGVGPGSFTGLRIAAAVIQGVAYAAGLPVVPVSTLAALAQGGHRRHGAGQVLCALDARMDEVYFGAYRVDRLGLMRPACEDMVAAPDAVWRPEAGGWLAVGPGWDAYPGPLQARLGDRVDGRDPTLYCEAQDILPLAADGLRRGRAVPPEQAVPVYLRNRVTADRRGRAD